MIPEIKLCELTPRTKSGIQKFVYHFRSSFSQYYIHLYMYLNPFDPTFCQPAYGSGPTTFDSAVAAAALPAVGKYGSEFAGFQATVVAIQLLAS